jgi:hypothetical protein
MSVITAKDKFTSKTQQIFQKFVNSFSNDSLPMKTTISLLFVSFLTPLFLVAQINYQPGLIIDNEGNTTQGYLKSYSPQKVAREITFKSEKSAKAKTYLPGEIKGFKYDDGRYYVSKELGVGSTSEIVFLEFLTEGEANLYFLRDEKGQRFFIEREGLVELKLIKKKVQVSDNVYEKKEEVFRKALREELDDSPEIQQAINVVPFDHDSLIDLTVKYHDYVCDDVNQECIVYRKDTKNDLYLGVEIEHMAASLGFTHAGAFVVWQGEEEVMKGSMQAICLKGAISQLFGFSPRTNLHFGIGYSQTNVSYTKFDFSHQNLIVPIYLTHRFWSNRFSPYVRVGIKNYLMLDQQIFNKLENEPSVLTGMMTPYQIGGQLGAGLSYDTGKVNFFISGTTEFRGAFTRNQWRNGAGKLLDDLLIANGVNLGFQVKI